ncbi:hypothetical protein BT69DRAFT_43145 [Atractiella rhizophila]|nr:hypothetical protein BT69DRAFT_43145 [Atractiella rhizophila]
MLTFLLWRIGLIKLPSCPPTEPAPSASRTCKQEVVLLSLPPELLSHILSFVSPFSHPHLLVPAHSAIGLSQRYQTYSNLSLVCHAFLPIAQKELYTHLSFSLSRSTRISAFASTLRSNPSIGVEGRTLKLTIDAPFTVAEDDDRVEEEEVKKEEERLKKEDERMKDDIRLIAKRLERLRDLQIREHHIFLCGCRIGVDGIRRSHYSALHIPLTFHPSPLRFIKQLHFRGSFLSPHLRHIIASYLQPPVPVPQ